MIHDSDETPPDDFPAAFDEFATRILRGEQVDLEPLKCRFPDRSEEIDELIGTVSNLAGWGGHCAAHPTTEATDSSDLRQLGEYRIVRELGRGGMGIVYEAEQMTLGRMVALKVLPFAALLDHRRLERFKNEARTAAMLKHPNIVSVHTVGQEKSIYYFAMELVDGLDLAKVIRSEEGEGSATTKAIASISTRDGGRTDFHPIARLGIEVAEALDFAHQQGVVHRDVKPSNIMLDDSGHVYVTDFGLARLDAADSLTTSGDLLGTLRYMSPEQISNGTTVDQRSDVYSLGATLYEIATGEPMWPGDDHADLLHRIAHGKPVRPSTINEALPRDLEKILLKAAANEPTERYQTAREFADDLLRFTAGLPVRARRNSTAQQLAKLARRHPWVSVGTSVFVLGLGIALAVTLMLLNRTTHAEKAARQALYHATIGLAYSAWDRGNLSAVESLLQDVHAQDRDLCGMEWNFLAHQLKATESSTAIDAGGTAASMEFSPDGTKLVVNLAEGWWNQHTKFYSLPSRKEWLPPVEVGGYSSFSPDGAQFLFCRGHEAFVCDTKTWNVEEHFQVTKLGEEGGLNQLGFLPLGRGTFHIIKNRDGSTSIFERGRNGPVRELEDLGQYDISRFAFARNGRALAARCWDNSIWLCDPDSLEPHTKLARHRSRIQWLGFSGDSTLLCSAAGRTDLAPDTRTRFWEVSTGQEKFPLPADITLGTSLSLSPTTRLAAVFGAEAGAVSVYDLTTGASKRLLGHHGRVICATWNKDGQALVTADDTGRIRFWDDLTPPPLDAARSVAKSPLVALQVTEEDAFVAVEHTNSRYHSPSEIFHYAWNSSQRTNVVPSNNSVTGLTVANGKLHATSREAKIRVWDVQAFPEEAAPIALDSPWTSEICSSPDGRMMAYGTYVDGPASATTVTLMAHINESAWDVVAKLPISNWPMALCFSPNGERLVAGGYLDGQLNVYSTRSHELLWQSSDHAERIRCIRFSPDGSTFASASSDRTVKLWSTTSGTCLATLTHESAVNACTFCDEGRRLVTGTSLGRLHFWDTLNRLRLGSFQSETISIGAIELSPRGDHLITAQSDGRISVHALADLEPPKGRP